MNQMLLRASDDNRQFRTKQAVPPARGFTVLWRLSRAGEHIPHPIHPVLWGMQTGDTGRGTG